MWIVRYKPQSTEPVFPDPTFFQQGASTGGLTSSVFDTIATVNTDVWTLMARKTWKIGAQQYTGGTNNDFSYSKTFRIDVTKHVAKTIVYNDTTVVPTSPCTYAIFEAVNANGTSNNNNGVFVQTWLDYDYTDV